jgi:hypothetical protein
MKGFLQVTFVILILIICGGGQVRGQDLSLIVSASDNDITMGDTVQFNSQVSGGNPPYSYCWDFGTPSQDAKLGEWNHNGKLICYSTGQNPSHTFNHYGFFEVWLYVEDSAGNSEYGYTSVNVPIGGTLIDPTQDCGANDLEGDGITDNGEKLANCIDSLGSGHYTLEFPSGTYRFVVEQDVTTADFDGLELRPAPESDVTLMLDPVETGLPEENQPNNFFIRFGSSHDFYIHDLKFQRDLDGGHHGESDKSEIMYTPSSGSSKNTVQRCQFNDFSNGMLRLRNILFEKSNIIGWGTCNSGNDDDGHCFQIASNPDDYECYMSLFHSAYHDVMIKNVYAKTSTRGSSHAYYRSPHGGDFHYLVGNYFDQYYQSRPSIFQFRTNEQTGDKPNDIYYYRNVVLGDKNEPVTDIKDGRQSDLFWATNYWLGDRFEFMDNICSGVESGYTITPASDDSTIWNWNKFYDAASNSREDALLYFRASSDRSVVAKYNEFGSGVPASGLYIWNLWGAKTNDLNPNSPEILAEGNYKTSNTFSVPDPGPWEFNPPEVNSFLINNGLPITSSKTISLNNDVSDSGSGMGSQPRWPYTMGALMQFSNDGVNWHEVEPYSSSHAWTLTDGYGDKTVFARFRDVDGNWGDPVTDTITYSESLGEVCPDTVCNGTETCFTCEADCGPCCGNSYCEPQYGEDCVNCPGDCSGDGDSDGFDNAVCGGNDCNDSNPNINPGVVEVCNNGFDDDCDGDPDCSDSQCFSHIACKVSGGKVYWSTEVPLYMDGTVLPEEGVLNIQIDDDISGLGRAWLMMYLYDADWPQGEGEVHVNGNGYIVLPGVDGAPCDKANCWFNDTEINKAWLVQGNNEFRFVHNATWGYHVLELGLMLDFTHRADRNKNGCIELFELLEFLKKWKISSQDVPMPELMEAIGRWNLGTGC